MSAPRVAMDARRLQDRPPGGVGRSLMSVLGHVAAATELVLLTDASRPPVATAVEQIPLARPAWAPETAWLQWSVPRWLRGYDGVFHGTFNGLPLLPGPRGVVTIHDLSFEVHPEDFVGSPGKRWVFRQTARRAARAARRIVTPSAHARDELVEHYRVAPERVTVIPWPVDPHFVPARADGAEEARTRLRITGPFVLAVGGARRRGLRVAFDAWQQVRAQGFDGQLVVIGPEAAPAVPGVVNAGPVDDDTYAALLAGAEVLCYPTRYEGFGMPPLESIASGTPVVCARVASLPEVLGEAAEWCDAPTTAAIAAGLRRVLDDGDRARALRARGLEHAAAAISAEDSARRLVDVYREVAGS